MNMNTISISLKTSWRFLKVALILIVCLVILGIQLITQQDKEDVVDQVLRLDYVKSVEDWPHGIKFARWDHGGQVDWNWLKILDKMLVPGRIVVTAVCSLFVARLQHSGYWSKYWRHLPHTGGGCTGGNSGGF